MQEREKGKRNQGTKTKEKIRKKSTSFLPEWKWVSSHSLGQRCPAAYRKWINSGLRKAVVATEIRDNLGRDREKGIHKNKTKKIQQKDQKRWIFRAGERERERGVDVKLHNKNVGLKERKKTQIRGKQVRMVKRKTRKKREERVKKRSVRWILWINCYRLMNNECS